MINQPDLFDNTSSSSNQQIISIDDGRVILYEHFFDINESDRILEILTAEIDWSQEYIKMYGKSIPLPRLTAWYGDISYTYSGITMNSKAWHLLLLDIKTKIESVCDRSFNGVLLNYYRDGNDSVSWHADDEPKLAENPVIGSVSFGGTRKFSLKHKNPDHPNHKQFINIDLTHGSLLLMTGECQSFWLHQIAKTKKKVDPRINLTFRLIH
ncbi:alpha-ketoglutarate-dependent dioxygenase AlkB [Chamaesiphon sp. VAR_48_metabat_403]|uniref:alpha-ketoglutarate-dependent dioxygenase AlkB family protein n=1 Tax=Chamaesiphon sp. VAR_48_metabat_403 TaxID=2964700 RepID=UPI00286E45D7|nr:alpha-ketoglutarate-dependent dioxygenase AlkB [Chamaesiphon sp. VAR_48_metabat_403]